MKTPNAAKLLTAALLVAGLSSGCAQYDPGIIIQGMIALNGEENDDGSLSCEVSADVDTNLFFYEAEIDLTQLREAGQDPLRAGATGLGFFRFPMHVRSRLADNQSQGGQSPTDQDSLRSNTNSIEIQQALIRFPAEANSFVGGVDTSAAVDDTGRTLEELTPREMSVILETENDQALIPIPIIRPQELSLFENFHNTAAGGNDSAAITLISEIQLVGETFDGSSVESNVLRFPINICLSCDQLSVTPTCVITD